MGTNVAVVVAVASAAVAAVPVLDSAATAATTATATNAAADAAAAPDDVSTLSYLSPSAFPAHATGMPTRGSYECMYFGRVDASFAVC